MSIFGSLFTAVSGMSAQSQSLSMISDNIANASTTGYKRNDAAFSTLVTNSGSSTPSKSSPPASEGRVITRRTKCRRGSRAKASAAAAISVSLPAPLGPTTTTIRPVGA